MLRCSIYADARLLRKPEITRQKIALRNGGFRAGGKGQGHALAKLPQQLPENVTRGFERFTFPADPETLTQ
ncbi:hypothetical protein [Aliiroseovarius sp.]|uniref:hypothetical protein n=1 Tax=Aliiroseovarius sp. TaxID=1872442 RepID=UPI0026124849|nr:hypothetical protein [Aliiroseovarius sp.]